MTVSRVARLHSIQSGLLFKVSINPGQLPNSHAESFRKVSGLA